MSVATDIATPTEVSDLEAITCSLADALGDRFAVGPVVNASANGTVQEMSIDLPDFASCERAIATAGRRVFLAVSFDSFG